MGLIFLCASLLLFLGLLVYRLRYRSATWKELLSFFVWLTLVRWVALYFR